MTFSDRMLKSALWYAEKRGWSVFPVHAPLFTPTGECYACTCEAWRRTEDCKQFKRHMYLGPGEHCKQPGKCPACRWAEKSTTDPAIICKWWGHSWRTRLEDGHQIYFTPNIGIDCGKSGLLVFDADAYKDVYPDNDLLSFDDKETVTALTGGGGEHLIYDRQGLPYGNSCRGLPHGIDIRGDGGYIVAAPSIHKSGRLYQWETGYGPHEINPAAIPLALRSILDKASHRRRDHQVGEPNSEAVKKAAAEVEQALKCAGVIHHGQQEYGGGRRWILPECPFMPVGNPHADDGGTFVVVLEDGFIAAGCHHNRCRHTIEDSGLSGWDFIKSKLVTVKPMDAGSKYPRVYRLDKSA